MKDYIKNKIEQMKERFPGSNRYPNIAKDSEIRNFLISEYPQYNIDKDTSLMCSLLLLDLKERPKCEKPECNNLVSYTNRKFPSTCSQPCRRDMDKTTGRMDEIVKKGRKTYKDRTGYDHQMHNPEVANAVSEYMTELFSDPVRRNKRNEKTKATNLLRYGEEWYQLTDEYRERKDKTIANRTDERKKEIRNNISKGHSKRTPRDKEETRLLKQQLYLDKTGKIHNTHTDEYWEKTAETRMTSHGTPYHGQAHYSDEAKQLFLSKENFEKAFNECEKHVTVMSRKYQIGDGTIRRFLDKWNIYNPGKERGRSSYEILIEEFLKNNGFSDFITNDRNILERRRELDFLFPELNLAIEFNGAYWHSTKVKKDKLYHFKKWKECNDLGINLITINEVEWLYNQNIWKNIILSLCGVKKSVEDYSIQKDLNISSFVIENSFKDIPDHDFSYSVVKDGNIIATMLFKTKDKTNHIIGYFENDCYNLRTELINEYRNHNSLPLEIEIDNRFENASLYEGFSIEKLDHPRSMHYSIHDAKRKQRRENLSLPDKEDDKEFLVDCEYWDCGYSTLKS